MCSGTPSASATGSAPSSSPSSCSSSTALSIVRSSGASQRLRAGSPVFSSQVHRSGSAPSLWRSRRHLLHASHCTHSATGGGRARFAPLARGVARRSTIRSTRSSTRRHLRLLRLVRARRRGLRRRRHRARVRDRRRHRRLEGAEVPSRAALARRLGGPPSARRVGRLHALVPARVRRAQVQLEALGLAHHRQPVRTARRRQPVGGARALTWMSPWSRDRDEAS